MSEIEITDAELNGISERAYRLGPDDGELARLCHADVPRLLAYVEQLQRGGKELGKTLIFLAELIKAAYVMGADDPIAALRMLGNHLAEVHESEGGLGPDEFNRVADALTEKQQRADRLEADWNRERDGRLEAEAALRAVRMVRCWKNEDKKSFVFADDLRAALDGSDQPADGGT